MQMDIAGYGGAQKRRHATLSRTRRFAFVGAAVAGVALLIATTVTFTAQNSSVEVASISGGAASVEVTSSLTTATSPAPGNWGISGINAKSDPSWAPVVGVPVSTGADGGDLIIVDTRASANTVTISVALQNAAELTNGYSAFILPIAIREASGVGPTTDWTTIPTGGDTQYLTLNSPVATFSVPGEKLYEVIVPGGDDAGIVVANSTSNLTPQFLIQAN